MTHLRRIASLMFIACLACTSRSAEDPASDAMEARDARALALVRAALAHRDSAFRRVNAPRFAAERVQFRSSMSEAVPGMSYWWGTYAPPATSDVLLERVAARGPTEARLLTTPDDWFAAARSADWRPASAAAALTGCLEAVRAAGPRRAPLPDALFYRDSFSVSNEAFGVYPESARAFAFERRFEEAEVSGDSARGFTAAFWMLEPGRMTRYRCVASATRFRLVAIDSSRDMGLVPLP